MSIISEKLFINCALLLLITLFISTYPSRAADLRYPDRFSSMNEEPNSEDYVHYLAKRRFLPTRREMHEYLPEDSSPENESDDSHLYSKRYFLKSKRYFLNNHS